MKMTFRYVLFALSFLIFLFMNQGKAPAQEADVVFFASWGDKEGEIGLIRKPEVEICGPQTFCVDGGNLFLADSVNRKILKIDSGKSVVDIAENISCLAMCGDGKGGVFVQEDNRIVHFNGSLNGDNKHRSPRLLHTIKDNKGGKARLIEGYGNELLFSKKGGVFLHTINQMDFQIPGAKNDRRSSIDDVQNLQYSIKRLPGNEVRLLGFDEEGKHLVSIPVIIDGGRPGAVLFKGQDNNGNLFVEVENLKPGRAFLELHSYSPEGRRLALFTLSNEYYSTVYKKTEIASDGSVYQLLTTPEGVRILHYIKGEENGGK